MSPRVKICGVTSPQDAEMVAEAGADAIGINFFGGSPRSVGLYTAKAICDVIPESVDVVALFVNEPLDNAAEFIRPIKRFRTIQWHGENPPTPNGAIERLIVSFPVAGPESLQTIESYLSRCGERRPYALVLDGSAAGKYGGTGVTVPWNAIADFRPGVPIILAGGLTPENVAEAVGIVKPHMVDVASGVESAPGKKDRDKVRRFIDNARLAATR